MNVEDLKLELGSLPAENALIEIMQRLSVQGLSAATGIPEGRCHEIMDIARCRLAMKTDFDRRQVVLQKDAEGNGYSPLTELYTAAYKAESTWSGEVGLEELMPEDREAGFTEEDVMEDGEPALVLRPVY